MLNAYDAYGQLDVILKSAMSNAVFNNLMHELHHRIVSEQWTSHRIFMRMAQGAVEADMWTRKFQEKQ